MRKKFEEAFRNLSREIGRNLKINQRHSVGIFWEIFLPLPSFQNCTNLAIKLVCTMYFTFYNFPSPKWCSGYVSAMIQNQDFFLKTASSSFRRAKFLPIKEHNLFRGPMSQRPQKRFWCPGGPEGSRFQILLSLHPFLHNFLNFAKLRCP